MGDKLIQVQNLVNLLDPEPYFILGALVVLAWFFYKFFLTDVSEERHQNIRSQFKNIFRHFLFFSTCFAIFILLHSFSAVWTQKSAPYIGILTMFWGMILFVKTSRLIILQYLFLGSMRAGVPVLIVNIFSLILSAALVIWVANQIFGFQVAPLLATSAAFSIILGLAIQDTLGNLFAGISLQMDKTFEIGDWLEITSGIQKCTGQVKEISWRGTLLVGLSDEAITLPNRYLANAQISNFTQAGLPIIRTTSFRIHYDVSPQLVRECLKSALKEVPGVCHNPEPAVFMNEVNENGIVYKLYYHVEDYGRQWSIGDRVTDAAFRALQAHEIEISPARVAVFNHEVHS